ncbi:MAG: hypothetical protein ACREIU_03105, partial [Planctomycetota bacterium]
MKKARPADGLPLFPDEPSTAVVAKRPSKKRPAAKARPEGGKASGSKGRKGRSPRTRPLDFEAPKEAKGGDGAAAPEAAAATPPRGRVTAEELGERQREISVAEFFT